MSYIEASSVDFKHPWMVAHDLFITPYYKSSYVVVLSVALIQIHFYLTDGICLGLYAHREAGGFSLDYVP